MIWPVNPGCPYLGDLLAAPMGICASWRIGWMVTNAPCYGFFAMKLAERREMDEKRLALYFWLLNFLLERWVTTIYHWHHSQQNAVFSFILHLHFLSGNNKAAILNIDRYEYFYSIWMSVSCQYIQIQYLKIINPVSI